MKRRVLAIILALTMILSMSACGQAASSAPENEETVKPEQSKTEIVEKVAETAPEIKGEVNIYTTQSDDLVMALTEFVGKKHPELTINAVKLNGGEMINRVMAEKENPQGDFLWGAACESYIDLANQDLLYSYRPAGADNYPDYTHDEEWNWYGFNLSYMGFYSDKEWFEAQGMDIPDSWEDLLDPRLKGQIIVTNPGTSTSGYMILSTIVQLMGEKEGLEYYAKLDENVKTYASGGSGPSQSVALGEAPVGIGYIHLGMNLIKEGYENMAITIPSEGVGIEVSSAAIINNCKNLDAAKAIADIMTSTEWAEYAREYCVGAMFACGVPGLGLEDFTDINLVDLDYEWASQNKDRLISEWDTITTK